jgi:hypothetical protein
MLGFTTFLDTPDRWIERKVPDAIVILLVEEDACKSF